MRETETQRQKQTSTARKKYESTLINAGVEKKKMKQATNTDIV